MTKRLIDLAAVFDEQGHSMLSTQHILERNRVLEARCERLFRLLKKRLDREKIDLPIEAPTRH